MTAKPCELIDRYLDDELDGISRQQFEQHLGRCTVCAAEVASAHKLDSLLVTAAQAPRAAPPGVIRRVRLGFHRRSKQRWLAASAMAASVLIALTATVMTLTWHRSSAISIAEVPGAVPSGSRDSMSDIAPDSRAETVATAPPVRIDIEVPGAIVLPIESSHPNVSVVWVYPAIESIKPRSP